MRVVPSAKNLYQERKPRSFRLQQFPQNFPIYSPSASIRACVSSQRFRHQADRLS